MKKRYAILICLVGCLLCACGKEKAEVPTSESETMTESVVETVPESVVESLPDAAPESAQESVTPESMQEPIPEETGTPKDYYAAFTRKDAVEVEDFAAQIQQDVANSDWESMASKMRFPFTIGVVTYYDSEAFYSDDWNQIFTEKFKEAIANDDCAEMPCTENGCTMGDGAIRISDRDGLMISGIWF